MIDKQIIIDGCDVSGCEWIREIELDSEYICTCNSSNKTSGYCKYNPNCHYKLYKCKEQELTHFKKENERLLQTIIKDQAEIVQKNIDETNILLIKENMDLQQQLKAKEQECEMWKNLTVDNDAVALKYQQQLDQLKAENRELKAVHSTNVALSDELFKYKAKNEELKKISCKFKDYCTCDTEKLKQTLAEIKEIAGKSELYLNIEEVKTATELEYDYAGKIWDLKQRIHKILQKISEYEVNNG